jgi:hypothetical protein
MHWEPATVVAVAVQARRWDQGDYIKGKTLQPFDLHYWNSIVDPHRRGALPPPLEGLAVAEGIATIISSEASPQTDESCRPGPKVIHKT